MNICEQEKDPTNFLYESSSFEELQNRFKEICENCSVNAFPVS